MRNKTVAKNYSLGFLSTRLLQKTVKIFTTSSSSSGLDDTSSVSQVILKSKHIFVSTSIHIFLNWPSKVLSSVARLKKKRRSLENRKIFQKKRITDKIGRISDSNTRNKTRRVWKNLLCFLEIYFVKILGKIRGSFFIL